MTSARDIFASGGRGGAFPKIDEFEHKLVLLKPSRIEYGVEGKFGPQDRVTTDVVVFDEENGTWDDSLRDMYFSQAGIVNACKKVLESGEKSMVLGVVSKVPSKTTKEMKPPLDTPEKVYKGLEEWRKKVSKGEDAPKPMFGWGLVDYTDAQGELAMKYVQSKAPFAPAQ